MNYNIEHLSWDSSFFEFAVARVVAESLTIQGFEEIIQKLREQGIHLGYLLLDEPLIERPKRTDEWELVLADEKITYQKSLSNFQEVNAVGEFQIVMEKYANLEMINLAIESGKFSRFCLDKRMPKGKFEELYGLWIQNSVSGNFADAVIICKIDNIIGGLVTLANKNRVGDIGIIAVDESYRGIGIGKALMRAAENWFIENKYLISQVVTQEINKPAKQLYEKCGFEIVKREFVYHIWMNS